MANKPKGFGMSADIARKQEAKFSADLSNKALAWIAAMLGMQDADVPADTVDRVKDKTVTTSVEMKEILKDGVLLLSLMNVIRPDKPIKINSSKMAFKQMENVGKFLEAANDLGCSKNDMFQSVDLTEGSNIPQVVNGIIAVGRKASAINSDWPQLGPKEAQENKREFTDEQLKEGKNVIGLQMGSNKGASQAGLNFGEGRQIIK